VRQTVTAVVFLIAGLAFAFGFGNGWALGVRLGVPAWIAPLVAPAVDLSVVALLAAVQYLRAHGVPSRLVGPRLLLVACGLITFALNTAAPLLADDYGRAGFDAIAPLLLIGWSEVGPRLLALLHTAGQPVPGGQDDQDGPVPAVPAPLFVPDRPGAVPAQVNGHPSMPAVAPVLAPTGEQRDEQDAARRDRDEAAGPSQPPAALIAAARRIDDEHRASTGRRVSRDALRARLRISNALAGQLLHHLPNHTDQTVNA
jgi:hypothetical protein